jgi:hypothetical protein
MTSKTSKSKETPISKFIQTGEGGTPAVKVKPRRFPKRPVYVSHKQQAALRRSRHGQD